VSPHQPVVSGECLIKGGWRDADLSAEDLHQLLK